MNQVSEYQAQFHTVKSFGERTQLSRSTIYRLIARGDLKPVKIGKSLRITESELRRFVESVEAGELRVS